MEEEHINEPIPQNIYSKDMEWLREVPDLDVDDGLLYCGSEALFIKFLKNFLYVIDDRTNDIKTALREGDLNNYTIKVHALKSSSRIMGARKLSKLAEELEYAGNNEDIRKIEKETDNLLSLLISYKDKLAKLGTETSEPVSKKDPISKTELGHAYDALKEFVPMMDFDAVDMILCELKEYELPPKDQVVFWKLEKMLKEFDWGGMEEIIENK